MGGSWHWSVSLINSAVGVGVKDRRALAEESTDRLCLFWRHVVAGSALIFPGIHTIDIII